MTIRSAFMKLVFNTSRLAVLIATLATVCGGCRKKEPSLASSTNVTLMASPAAAEGQDHAITVDDDAVYWVRSDGKSTSLVSVPKSGGTEKVLATVADSYAVWVVVDDKNAYWITIDEARRGTIWSVPKSGGVAIPIATGEVLPRALAVSGGYLYWLTTDEVRSAPIAGGPASTLQAGQRGAAEIAVDGGEIYWLTDVNRSRPTDLSLKKMPVGGGKATTVASFSEKNLFGFALTATDAYVLADGGKSGSRVKRVPRGGGPPVDVANVPGEGPWALVAEGANLYFTCSRSGGLFEGSDFQGSVFQMAAAGGPVTELARPRMPMAVAIDRSGIYWLDQEKSETLVVKRGL